MRRQGSDASCDGTITERSKGDPGEEREGDIGGEFCRVDTGGEGWGVHTLGGKWEDTEQDDRNWEPTTSGGADLLSRIILCFLNKSNLIITA